MTDELVGAIESSPELVGCCEPHPEIIVNLVAGAGGGTMDHEKLTNRDTPDQHPMSAITGLIEALKKDVEYGKTLKVVDGVLDVNTADNVEKDNTLPVTSAAVYTEIGNIEVLLKTI